MNTLQNYSWGTQRYFKVPKLQYFTTKRVPQRDKLWNI